MFEGGVLWGKNKGRIRGWGLSMWVAGCSVKQGGKGQLRGADDSHQELRDVTQSPYSYLGGTFLGEATAPAKVLRQKLGVFEEL